MSRDVFWFVYIVKTSCDKLYTGISTDVERRYKEHCNVYNKVNAKGAKFFRGHKPIAVVYTEQCATRSEATKRECRIKTMSKLDKLSLIEKEST